MVSACRTQTASLIGVLVLSLSAACAGYWQLYSSFARYDDEGYVLLSLRMFQAGHPLYDATATQYGPAYFFLQDALHRLLRLPVTHDTARAKTLCVWLATALCAAALTRRWTGQWLLAVLAGLGTMWHLDRLGLEPGHPQDQALLLWDALLLLACRSSSLRSIPTTHAAVMGVVVGTLAMTKLNLGVLTGLAVVGALTLELPSGAVRNWLWRGVVAAGLALPCVLAGPHALTWQGAALPIVNLLGWSAFVVRQFTTEARRHGDELPDVSSLHRLPAGRDLSSAFVEQHEFNSPQCLGVSVVSTFLAAAVATTLLFLVLANLDGTSLGGLWHGLVGQHRGFLDLFYHHPPLPEIAPIAAVGGLWLALWSWRDARAVAVAQWLSLALLLTAALHVCCDSFLPLSHGLVDRAAAGWLAACVPGLSWALLAGTTRPFARRLLGLLTLVGPLGAYPTPGTQLAIGTLPALLSLFALTGDLTTRLTASSSTALPPLQTSLRGLAVLSLLTLVCRDVSAYRRWSAQEPLRLPGAEWLRLPSDEAASRRAAVSYLRTHADAFVAAPTGCCSFYLWTGIAPPTTRNVTFWEVQLSEREQLAVVAALDRARQPCVLIDRGQTPVQYAAATLHRYITERFTDRVLTGRFEIHAPARGGR